MPDAYRPRATAARTIQQQIFIPYKDTHEMMPWNFVSNLAVSCWLGGAALFTFGLTPKLFAAYSQDQASAIVGLLFPGYFR